MTYRSDANLDARRAALEELRTAHRVLLACPRPTALTAALARIFGSHDWSFERQRSRVRDENHAVSELEYACGCVRRALVLVDGTVRVDLRGIDPAKIPALDRFVAELFDQIYSSDPPLTDIEPLAIE